MSKYSAETKATLVKKVLSSADKSARNIAKAEGIPPSTLEGWVRQYRKLTPTSKIEGTLGTQHWTQAERFKILVESSNLAEEEVGAYCRKKGLYQEQLRQWEQAFMQQGDTEKTKQLAREIKVLRTEIKALKQEIGRKDRALAETTSLLVLKKKLALLCEESEDDTYR